MPLRLLIGTFRDIEMDGPPSPGVTRLPGISSFKLSQKAPDLRGGVQMKQAEASAEHPSIETQPCIIPNFLWWGEDFSLLHLAYFPIRPPDPFPPQALGQLLRNVGHLTRLSLSPTGQQLSGIRL